MESEKENMARSLEKLVIDGIGLVFFEKLVIDGNIVDFLGEVF